MTGSHPIDYQRGPRFRIKVALAAVPEESIGDLGGDGLTVGDALEGAREMLTFLARTPTPRLAKVRISDGTDDMYDGDWAAPAEELIMINTMIAGL